MIACHPSQPLARHPTMTPDQFTEALTQLGWKQSDFSRMTATDKKTPSRWAQGHTAIPGWVPSYLAMALAIHGVAATITPPKA